MLICRTSKILFRDAIEAIKKYAFLSTTSPLILSLEIHCCLEQQDLLASIMIEVFGEHLVTAPLEAIEKLPSPKMLEGKILLKTKVSSVDDDSDDSAPISEGPSPVMNRTSIISRVGSPSNLVISPALEVSRKSSTTRKSKRIISKSLSNLVVYFRGKPSKDIDIPLSEELKFNQLLSFNDRKATSLMQKSLSDFKMITKNRLIRVYPSIIRVNSSNFDPVPHWCSGSQMVALNFQTSDRFLDLNRALFKISNGYGYIPRPRCIFEIEKNEPSVVFSITIISAQQIHVEGLDQIKSEVGVEIIGHDRDTQRVKTASIKSNGLNCIWKQHFSFPIIYPQLAFLRIEIFTSDSITIGSSVSRTFTATLESLEQGFRHIPLRSNSKRPGDLSTLFAKISFESGEKWN